MTVRWLVLLTVILVLAIVSASAQVSGPAGGVVPQPVYLVSADGQMLGSILVDGSLLVSLRAGGMPLVSIVPGANTAFNVTFSGSPLVSTFPAQTFTPLTSIGGTVPVLLPQASFSGGNLLTNCQVGCAGGASVTLVSIQGGLGSTSIVSMTDADGLGRRALLTSSMGLTSVVPGANTVFNTTFSGSPLVSIFPAATFSPLTSIGGTVPVLLPQASFSGGNLLTNCQVGCAGGASVTLISIQGGLGSTSIVSMTDADSLGRRGLLISTMGLISVVPGANTVFNTTFAGSPLVSVFPAATFSPLTSIGGTVPVLPLGLASVSLGKEIILVSQTTGGLLSVFTANTFSPLTSIGGTVPVLPMGLASVSLGREMVLVSQSVGNLLSVAPGASLPIRCLNAAETAFESCAGGATGSSVTLVSIQGGGTTGLASVTGDPGGANAGQRGLLVSEMRTSFTGANLNVNCQVGCTASSGASVPLGRLPGGGTTGLASLTGDPGGANAGQRGLLVSTLNLVSVFNAATFGPLTSVALTHLPAISGIVSVFPSATFGPLTSIAFSVPSPLVSTAPFWIRLVSLVSFNFEPPAAGLIRSFSLISSANTRLYNVMAYSIATSVATSFYLYDSTLGPRSGWYSFAAQGGERASMAPPDAPYIRGNCGSALTLVYRGGGSPVIGGMLNYTLIPC